MAEKIEAKVEKVEKVEKDERDDRGERRGRRRYNFGNPEAVSDYYRGVAHAYSEGLRAYEDRVDPDSVEEAGYSNGFASGLVSGYATFYEEMADTARRVHDRLVERETRNREDRRERERERDRDRDRHATEPRPHVDHERLAQLVATELRKSGVVITNK